MTRPIHLCIAALALCGALLACAAPANRPAPTDAQILDADRVIALLADTRSQRPLLAAAQAGGYALIGQDRLDALDLRMLTFRMPPGVTGPEAIRFLETADPASTVGVNHAYRPVAMPSAPGTDYAADLLGWPEPGCRARAPVGMIDTAVDPGAPSLSAARITARSFTQGPAAPARHGTEVAAVLANPRLLNGVAIHSAAVVRPGETGDAAGADAIIRAMDWLGGSGVSLVNISLAGPFNKLLDRALRASADRGMVVVAAIGNDGPDAAPLYPAAFPDALAVTAVDAGGRIWRRANRGAHVDFAAPGVDVLVGADGEEHFVSGTSIAAPFVTARILADPALARLRSAGAMRAAMQDRTQDLGQPGWDSTYGAGLPSLYGACPG